MPLSAVSLPAAVRCRGGNHRPLSLALEARVTPAWPPGARTVAPVRAWVLGDVAAVKKEKGEGATVKP